MRSVQMCVYVCIIFGCLKFYFIQKKKNWFTICIFSSSCITSFDSISGKFYLYNLFQIFLYFLFGKKKKILSENWFLFIWQCSVLTSWVEQNIPPSSFFPSKYNWIYKNGFHSFIICLEVVWSILEEYKKSVHNSKKKKKILHFFCLFPIWMVCFVWLCTHKTICRSLFLHVDLMYSKDIH